MTELIRVEDLEIEFALREGTVRVVNGISLAIPANRTMGLVGESGCGKSVTAKALLGILPKKARIARGRILFNPGGEAGAAPVDIAALGRSSEAMRKIRGSQISMIFQEPMASFSPVHTIGNQIGEVLRLHQRVTRAAARERVLEMLSLVSIPMPERRIDSYPHELSGGLRQRAMIAMALACRPRLVVADEPTTALDVTIQAQILNLLRELQRKLGMAILMITHDLGVVANIVDEVAVMYLGRIVEQGTVEEIYRTPRHPYTQGLIDSVPKLGSGNSARLASIPGSVPNAFARLAGCPFHPRCAKAIAGTCDQGEPPELLPVEGSVRVACHLCPPKTAAGSAQAAAADKAAQDSPRQEVLS